MKLYHGSPRSFETIKKSQAQKGQVEVPEDELLNGIYLSPNYSFALAIGAMPDGAAHINDAKKEIEFEHPEKFDPDKEVFVYEIDSDKIPQELLKTIDENQVVVMGTNELKPDLVHRTTAREVLSFYRIKDYTLNENREFKVR